VFLSSSLWYPSSALFCGWSSVQTPFLSPRWCGPSCHILARFWPQDRFPFISQEHSIFLIPLFLKQYISA
jgi:hypothetical protein